MHLAHHYRLNHQHDLALRAGLEHRLMRASGLSQRHFTADNRVQRAVAEAGYYRRVCLADLIVGRIEQHQPADVGVASHRVAGSDLDAAATPHDNHASVLREEAEIAIEIEMRSHFDDQVDAATAGGLHDGVGVSLGAVV